MTQLPSLQEIARALGGEVSGDGKQVRAPGEGHSAEDRSLSVMPDPDAPDGFIVKSFAGDDELKQKDYVRAKLGLPPFRANGQSAKTPREVETTYDYRDETGEPLHQTVRFKPKGFAQRRPARPGEETRDGWVWSLKGVRLVLYRLPELIEAVSTDRTVFICEGEKAVDALIKLGVPATCSPMGAGKWHPQYAQYFTGAAVVILPDNDPAGRKHAEDVARSLASMARSVKKIDLPNLAEKADAFDWIAAGGTADLLWNLVENAPLFESTDDAPAADTSWRAYTITAADLHAKKFPPINYIVPNFIPEGLCLLAGRPKVGKSWLALDICLGVSLGREVLGVEPAHGDVLYCALEDTDRRLQRRMSKLLWPSVPRWPQNLTLATRWRKLDAGGVEDIAEWVATVGKPRLVVLDTLAGVRPDRHQRDTTYDGDYKALLEVHRLANEGGFAVLVLTHTRKMDAEDKLDTISGTLGQVGCADTGMVLNKGPQGASLYVRGRDIEESEYAVNFSPDTCRWTIIGNAADVRRSETRNKILATLEEANEVMKPDEIARATGLTRNAVDQQLHKMVKSGEVVVISRGKYAHPSKAYQFKEAG